MSDDFKIIQESTKKFVGGELCVMLILCKGIFSVEVVTQNKSFGRKATKDREQAEFLFQTIEDSIFRYSKLVDASATLEKCFSFKTIDKIIFVIYVQDRIISQDDIVYLRKHIHFRTIIKNGYYDKVKQPGIVTIYIVPDFDKKPFGYLVGKDTLRELQFKLL